MSSYHQQATVCPVLQLWCMHAVTSCHCVLLSSAPHLNLHCHSLPNWFSRAGLQNLCLACTLQYGGSPTPSSMNSGLHHLWDSQPVSGTDTYGSQCVTLTSKQTSYLTSTTAPDSLRKGYNHLALAGSCAQQRPGHRRWNAHHVYVGASSCGKYNMLAAGLSPAVFKSKCAPVRRSINPGRDTVCMELVYQITHVCCHCGRNVTGHRMR